MNVIVLFSPQWHVTFQVDCHNVNTQINLRPALSCAISRHLLIIRPYSVAFGGFPVDTPHSPLLTSPTKCHKSSDITYSPLIITLRERSDNHMNICTTIHSGDDNDSDCNLSQDSNDFLHFAEITLMTSTLCCMCLQFKTTNWLSRATFFIYSLAKTTCLLSQRSHQLMSL